MALKICLLSIGILLNCSHLIQATCCSKITVTFSAIDRSDCSNFGALNKLSDYNFGSGFGGAHAVASSITNLVMRNCQIDLCGDGESVGHRRNCAYGSCNLFGCNCDGGCVPGDPSNAMQIFSEKYPGQLRSVGFERPTSYLLSNAFG